MKTSTAIEIVALLLILGLAAYLRFANVAENPGWYSDEGTDIDIAVHLLRGQSQYLALTQSTLLAARPPLFHIVLAGLFRVFGAGIETLRAFTAGLGVLSVLLLYVATRAIQGRAGAPLALLAALLLAIYPQAVVYSRIGYSYNWLTPLVLVSFLGLVKYLENSRAIWLGLAACAIGLGAVAVLMSLMFVPALVLVVTLRRWRDLWWSLPLAALPFGLYAAIWLIHAPQAFLFDWNFVMFRVGRAPLLIQLPVAVINYTALLTQDYWLAPAMIGLFMARPPHWQKLSLLAFFLPLFLLARTTGLADLGFYYLIPLFPFVALGMANLIRYGTPSALRTIRDGFKSMIRAWTGQPVSPTWRWLQARALAWGVSLSLFVILVSPFLMDTVSTITQIRTGFRTRMDPILLNPQDVRQTADFVNRHVQPSDLVIASPALAWLVHSRVADFQLAAAAAGEATMHFPANIPVNRFAFDPRYTRARFIIVDPVWRNWAVLNMTKIAEMMRAVTAWPLEFKSGEIEVYRNPAQ